MKTPSIVTLSALVVISLVASQVNCIPGVQHIQTITGSQVEIPCNLGPIEPPDNVTLILWYRGSSTTPFFALDARDHPVKEGIHWADENTLNGRASFEVRNSTLGVLIIKDLQAQDAGLYVCRVDYEVSQTYIEKTNVSVKDFDIEVQFGQFSRFRVQIACIGRAYPLPELSFTRDGEPLDSSATLETMQRGDHSIAFLTLKQTFHNFGVYTCNATNVYGTRTKDIKLGYSSTYEEAVPEMLIHVVQQNKELEANQDATTKKVEEMLDSMKQMQNLMKQMQDSMNQTQDSTLEQLLEIKNLLLQKN